MLKIDAGGWFLKNNQIIFMLVGVATTGAEVQNLVEAAVLYRDMHMLTAISRYGLIGTFEILFTILFIIQFSRSMDRAYSDDRLTFKEFLWIVLKCSAIFLFGLLFTSFIHKLYYEATWNLETQFYVGNNLLTRTFPVLSVRMEADCAFFIHSTCRLDCLLADHTLCRHGMQIESGAVFLIYMTPLTELFSVVFKILETMDKTWKKRREEAPYDDDDNDDDDDEEDDDNDETYDDDNRTNPDEIPDDDAIEAMDEVLDLVSEHITVYNNTYKKYANRSSIELYSKSDIRKSIFRRCGIDIDNRTLWMYRETSPKVKAYNDALDKGEDPPSNAILPKDEFRNINSIFVGSNVDVLKGRKGMKKCLDRLQHYLADLKAAEKEFEDYRDDTSSTGSDKREGAVRSKDKAEEGLKEWAENFYTAYIVTAKDLEDASIEISPS